MIARNQLDFGYQTYKNGQAEMDIEIKGEKLSISRELFPKIICTENKKLGITKQEATDFDDALYAICKYQAFKTATITLYSKKTYLAGTAIFLAFTVAFFVNSIALVVLGGGIALTLACVALGLITFILSMISLRRLLDLTEAIEEQKKQKSYVINFFKNVTEELKNKLGSITGKPESQIKKLINIIEKFQN